ncbi:hypothetical protein ACFLZP_03500, partial [Patescibacteria group bacterium]
WSLVLTNLFALPLMNAVGLFLEESEGRDYLGILSFFVLSYVLVPFQAYASVKGFLEKDEGGWFRTPKTGRVTDIFKRGHFYRWITRIIPGWQPLGDTRGKGSALAASLASQPTFVKTTGGKPAFSSRLGLNRDSLSPKHHPLNPYLSLAMANNRFGSFQSFRRPRRVSRGILVILLVFTVTLLVLTQGRAEVLATDPATSQYLANDTTATLTNSWKLLEAVDTQDSSTSLNLPKGSTLQRYAYEPGVTGGSTAEAACQDGGATGKGWILDVPFEVGGFISAGAWDFSFYESDSPNHQAIGTLEVCAYRVVVSGGAITNSYLIFDTGSDATWPATDIIGNDVTNNTYTTQSIAQVDFSAGEYLYVQYSLDLTGTAKDTSTVFYTGETGSLDPKVVLPAITIPENAILLMGIVPFIPLMMIMVNRKKRLVLVSRKKD